MDVVSAVLPWKVVPRLSGVADVGGTPMLGARCRAGVAGLPSEMFRRGSVPPEMLRARIYFWIYF